MSGVMSMAAGTGLPPALIKYWTAGEGAGKIRWGAPEGGDFARCKREIQKAITDGGKSPLAPNVIDGLCATLHKIATGASPGHAASEKR
jgi:hypothetical protein